MFCGIRFAANTAFFFFIKKILDFIKTILYNIESQYGELSELVEGARLEIV